MGEGRQSVVVVLEYVVDLRIDKFPVCLGAMRTSWIEGDIFLIRLLGVEEAGPLPCGFLAVPFPLLHRPCEFIQGLIIVIGVEIDLSLQIGTDA